MDEGILYVARGSNYVSEAIKSARQVKEVMPEVSISIIADEEVSSELFDEVMLRDLDPELNNKVFRLDESPYEKTIFLDTDIYVTESISEIFELLDSFDIGVSINQLRTEKSGNEAFPEYNTGVLGYKKNDAFLDFQNSWKEKYEPNSPDQPSFRKALLNSDLRIATLPREYNCRVIHPGQVYGSVKVFHGRLMDMDSGGAPLKVSMEESVNRINSMKEVRVFTYNRGKIKVYGKKKAVYKQVLDGIRQYGFRKTLIKGLRKAKLKCL